MVALSVGKPESNIQRSNLANFSMVTLGRLSKEDLMFVHLFLIGERDSVYSLKGVIRLVAQEIRSRALDEGKNISQ